MSTRAAGAETTTYLLEGRQLAEVVDFVSELARRGVGRAQADRALASYNDALQLASAMRIIERTYGKREITDYREMLDRVGNKLLRLGFSTTIVRGACRAVISGTLTDAEAQASPSVGSEA